MVAVAILAAGKGTRMKSSLPKVLHPLGSRSLVERVLNVSESLHPQRKLVIIGYQGQQVRNTLQHLDDIEFVEQKEQLGTGHAIQQLIPHLEDFQTVRHWPCYSAVNPPFRGLSGGFVGLKWRCSPVASRNLAKSSPDSSRPW